MTTDFWIIDTEAEGINAGSKTAAGPFPSQVAAEKWLIEDARNTFLDADKSCRELTKEKKWGAPVHIVKVVRTVEQCPTVKVDIQLKTVYPHA